MNLLSKYKPKKNKNASSKDKRALVRVDYNVPLKNNRIVDPRRIDASFESIDKLLKIGMTPILIAHLADPEASLRPVAKYLAKKYKIVFVTNDVFDSRTKEIIDSVPDGTLILIENIRRYEQEEKNDRSLAKALASFGAIYINDAFSVSHRSHASVVSLPKLLPSFAGYQFEREIKALSSVLNTDKHPLLFILGGAKFSTKIPLLTKFENKADNIIIGGAILNNFYKVAGFEVGQSVVEDGYDKPIKKLLKNEKLLLPVDVVVEHLNKKNVITVDEITKSDTIVDIGPQSIALATKQILEAKVVVWNGPMGWYEKGYTKGTIALATALANSKAIGLIGGGDTGAAIEKISKSNTNKKIFISTAGGAALDFLTRGTLPGIKALG